MRAPSMQSAIASPWARVAAQLMAPTGDGAAGERTSLKFSPKLFYEALLQRRAGSSINNDHFVIPRANAESVKSVRGASRAMLWNTTITESIGLKAILGIIIRVLIVLYNAAYRHVLPGWNESTVIDRRYKVSAPLAAPPASLWRIFSPGRWSDLRHGSGGMLLSSTRQMSRREALRRA